MVWVWGIVRTKRLWINLQPFLLSLVRETGFESQTRLRERKVSK